MDEQNLTARLLKNGHQSQVFLTQNCPMAPI